MFVRNLDGLKAKLRATTTAKKQRLREAVVSEADKTLVATLDACPVDSGFMRANVRLEFTREGYNWAIGFRAEDFIGQENPKGVTITAFYPVFVIKGTRHMAGNDFLTAVLHLRKAQIRARYARALAD